MEDRHFAQIYEYCDRWHGWGNFAVLDQKYRIVNTAGYAGDQYFGKLSAGVNIDTGDRKSENAQRR